MLYLAFDTGIYLLYFSLFHTLIHSSILFVPCYITKTTCFAVLIAVVFGSPFHRYGNIKGKYLFTLVGSVAMVSIPLLIIIFHSIFLKQKRDVYNKCIMMVFCF